jgi:hypothetical protein
MIVASNLNNPDFSKSHLKPFPLVYLPVPPAVSTHAGSQTLRLLL